MRIKFQSFGIDAFFPYFFKLAGFFNRNKIRQDKSPWVFAGDGNAGKKSDEAGRTIVQRLEREGLEIADYRIIPDDGALIAETLIAYANRDRLDLVLTTGGTGFSPRDNTPEAMLRVIEREIPGIPEAARAYGQARTPYSMLSRGKAGLRGAGPRLHALDGRLSSGP